MIQANLIETEVVNCYYCIDGRTAGWFPVKKDDKINFVFHEIFSNDIEEAPKPIIPVEKTGYEGARFEIFGFISDQVDYVELALSDTVVRLTDELDKFIYFYWNLGLGEVNLNDLISKSEKEISSLSLSPGCPIYDLHQLACQAREAKVDRAIVRTSPLSFLRS